MQQQTTDISYVMHFNFPSNIKVCKYKTVQTLWLNERYLFCVQKGNDKAALSTYKKIKGKT